MDGFLKDPFIVQNLTFGIEDSVISTTGVLLGVAAAKFKRRDILITGIILITVEALSMSYGAFLSNENFMKTAQQKYTIVQIIEYALVMFFSYFAVGLLLLMPFALRFPNPSVWVISLAMVILTLIILVYEKRAEKVAIMLGIGAVLMTVSVLLGKNIK